MSLYVQACALTPFLILTSLLLEVCIAKFQNLRTYYRKEKKKLSTFRSGTGAEDFVPKWEPFARLQFLDDTINPVESTSNLDYMELEIDATPLNVSVSTDEDLFETIVESPPIPCSGSQISHLQQGTRVSTVTPKAKKKSRQESRRVLRQHTKMLGGCGKKKKNSR
ncbi:hypothetical protein TNIN_52851 [Trichonephila inaurata madagascariensis]|uniref:MADF domain-containing protein n=1 Tax=Trichonephila inaurata madagascariensis TaxID=2747483 RepID=A0A8X7BWX6_9ARAC|nr:hypothetical protein TNIN_52851 [Trichonephila inaurata madagascariensis]